ncbi:MAG: hypothetical protein FWC78_03280 [Defluviitaleaceae bacterium]|nr:hypothetical protein [Defluviitaleaceae bacterium]
MKTKKHEELIASYLNALDAEIAPLYKEIILFLSELGYNPVKLKSCITFKHKSHTKQIVKMGNVFFSLRFSACRRYSQRFVDIVSAAINKVAANNPANNPYQVARCITGDCNACKGKADTHVYAHTYPNGETKYACGCYAMRIPNITANDIPEIKKLINEEHAYLLIHEAKA